MVKVSKDRFIISKSMLLLLKFLVIEIWRDNFNRLLFIRLRLRLDHYLSKRTHRLLNLVLYNRDFLLPILSNLVNRLIDILVPLLNLVDHSLSFLNIQYLLIYRLFLIFKISSWEPVQVCSRPLLGSHILDSVQVPLNHLNILFLDAFQRLYLRWYFLNYW